jgi:CheY-like chemotaxis protein
LAKRANVKRPSPATVLPVVVEDFDDTRAMIRLLLEMKGCRVLEAVNGREAEAVSRGRQTAPLGMTTGYVNVGNRRRSFFL